MYSKEFWLAWGTLADDMKWAGDPITEDINSQELFEEVGRIKNLVKEYVVLDSNGIIEIDNLKWTISNTRTKYIYLKFTFDQNHNSTDEIFQLGIFTDTVPSAGFENENYLQPSNIDDIGNLLELENQPILYRNSATRETYEFVITF
jgi:hypothetical protein